MIVNFRRSLFSLINKSYSFGDGKTSHRLCIPSHLTHLPQPLDIYTLEYIKQKWKQLLWERNKTSLKSMKNENLYSYSLKFTLLL